MDPSSLVICTAGLFFEHFEKTQGLPKKTQGTFWTKNSREWSQLRILAKKTQGKLTLMGSFLEEWQDFGHFYYQIDHILSKYCIHFK